MSHSTESSHTTPDVSVVIISYNDAERLPVAVNSVTDQTLRNVEVVIADDCSTDHTPDVVQQLMLTDSRIRYTRLPVNSGGCGGPRNAGIELARAANIMFLDSDDVLERHACKNLLNALESTGSDMAQGVCMRHEMAEKRWAKWYPWLYETERTIHGIDEFPDLIYDTISVNKIYRRDFLDRHSLRFPLGIHYEDQLFTIQAYAAAAKIAIIPQHVYSWKIFPPHKQKESSISNRRHHIKNFEDRLTINRRIDDFLSSSDLVSLKQVKDVKFLKHDMRLYLNDVILGDPIYIEELLRLARPYLKQLDENLFTDLPLHMRTAYGMALREDVSGLRDVSLLDQREIFSGRITPFEGGLYWSARRAPAGIDTRFATADLENSLLNVANTSLASSPVDAYDAHHSVQQIRHSDSAFEFSGTSFCPAARNHHKRWRARLVAWNRKTGEKLHFPLRITGTAEEFSWTANLPGTSALFSPKPGFWPLGIEMDFDGRRNLSQIQWETGPTKQSAELGGFRARLLRERFQLARTSSGQLILRFTERSEQSKAIAGKMLATERFRKQLAERLERFKDEKKSEWRPHLYRLMRRVPLNRNQVLFESNMGKSYSDNPKYLHEAVRRFYPNMRAVWSFADPQGKTVPGARTVRRDSYAYLWALSRSKYWVDNQTFPGYVRKRPEQRYLQTWHGIPLKTLGLDEGDKNVIRKREFGHYRGVGAWDALVVPNTYFEKVFVPAFDFDGELIKYGTPRNDPIVNQTFDRGHVLDGLGIPREKKIILYAPTFRAGTTRGDRRMQLRLDLGRLSRDLGSDWVVLVRPHYLNRLTVPASARSAVIEVSDVADVNELYAAADVLVTDYSSVMFDYALTRKPIVFYAYDYDEYVNESRGTYFDLRSVAPGPFVESEEDLVPAILASLDPDPEMLDRYSCFVETYCGDEDGMASERAARALLETVVDND